MQYDFPKPNGEDAPNYFPNSFDDIYTDESYKEKAMILDSAIADRYDRKGTGDNDHITQPGKLLTKAMNDYHRHHLVANIIGAMSGIAVIKKRAALCLFFSADVQLGMAVAKGLGVDIENVMKELKHPVKDLNVEMVRI